MSQDEETDKKVVEAELADQSGEVLDLKNDQLLDLSGLDEEAKRALTLKAHEAKIDIQKKAAEAQVDLQGTKINLDNLNDTVKESTREGTSITVTHTQTTSVGRTEVVMGNTERAASGKISRGGAGLEDNTIKILVGVGIIAIIVALILSNSG